MTRVWSGRNAFLQPCLLEEWIEERIPQDRPTWGVKNLRGGVSFHGTSNLSWRDNSMLMDLAHASNENPTCFFPLIELINQTREKKHAPVALFCLVTIVTTSSSLLFFPFLTTS